MAKRTKNQRLPRESGDQQIAAIRKTLQGLARQLDTLRGNVEGSDRIDELKVVFSSLEIKAAAAKLKCNPPSTMSFYGSGG